MENNLAPKTRKCRFCGEDVEVNYPNGTVSIMHPEHRSDFHYNYIEYTTTCRKCGRIDKGKLYPYLLI